MAQPGGIRFIFTTGAMVGAAMLACGQFNPNFDLNCHAVMAPALCHGALWPFHGAMLTGRSPHHMSHGVGEELGAVRPSRRHGGHKPMTGWPFSGLFTTYGRVNFRHLALPGQKVPTTTKECVNDAAIYGFDC